MTDKHTIAAAQATRLQQARMKAEPPVAGEQRLGVPVVLSADDRDRVLGLFSQDEMTMPELHKAWLVSYEPRPHLRWWIRIVLTALNDRSQVSIRFDDEQPVWSLIHI